MNVPGKAEEAKEVPYKIFNGPNIQGAPQAGVLKMAVFPEVSKKQALDTVIPVLFIHGGGWSFGTNAKDLIGQWTGLLRNPYFRVFSMDFRLAPCSGYYPPYVQNGCWSPEDLRNDVRDAVRFIKTHARLYHVNPNRLILIGESAGAHMALMHALHASKPEETRTETACPTTFEEHQIPTGLNCDSRVAGVADFYGPAVFDDLVEKNGATLSALFNTPFEKIQAAVNKRTKGDPLSTEEIEFLKHYDFADPFRNLHPQMPSILMSYTVSDFLVPYSNFEKLNAGIQQVNARAAAQAEIPGGFPAASLFNYPIVFPPPYLTHTFLYTVMFQSHAAYQPLARTERLKKSKNPAKDAAEILINQTPEPAYVSSSGSPVKITADLREQALRIESQLIQWMGTVRPL